MSLLTAPLLPFALLRRLFTRPRPTEDLRRVHAGPTERRPAPDPTVRAARARTEAESYLSRRQAELQADLEARR